MSRVKGYIFRDTPVRDKFLLRCGDDAVYVEEIPSDAVRVEGKVVDGPFLTKDGELELDFYLPAHLIGKKVQVIIFDER